MQKHLLIHHHGCTLLQHGPPPRPPFRPSFGGMRGPPGPLGPPGMHGPPRPPPPPPMMMRGPPNTQGPPGPGPMHHPHPHPHPPMGMPMGGGPVGMGMPHPHPGFVPGPMPPMGPGYSGPMPGPMPGTMAQPLPPNFGNGVNSSVSTQLPPPLNSSSIMSAPTIYAAPPVKSQSDHKYESNIRMLETCTASSITHTQKTDRYQIIKGPVTEEQSNTLFGSGGDDTSTTKKKEKKRKVVRMAGGQVWEDNSLHEWENDDFRIFCGDLGNDVTDEVLTRAFSKFGSFVKAKVVRDKRTNKTKGFGFISFKDPQDFIKAMREMNGKYVGSRPIKLRTSTWKDRNMDVVLKKQREKDV